MEADYGDVVPRRDFERLEAQFNVRYRSFYVALKIIHLERFSIEYRKQFAFALVFHCCSIPIRDVNQ